MPMFNRLNGNVEAVEWDGRSEADMKALIEKAPAEWADSTIKSFVEDEKYCLFLRGNKFPMYPTDWLVLDAGRLYVLNKSQFKQVFIDIPAAVGITNPQENVIT